ncbi:MAG: carbonic anhydrase [Reyranella sp.]|uniref:carbonic anhydrase n=1 Tax=Reyranella sp. TaxID=1929291 RepID=UPI003D138461
MALARLLQGFADFRLGYYRDHLDLFQRLASEGQSPKILIIGCSDARVDPGILTQTRPGDIFTVRNVAALVPPAQLPPDQRHHGTSAAIEFAVRGLEVEHVVVLGHALCGGIAALVDGSGGILSRFDYLSTWTSIAREVRDEIVRALEGQPREQVLRAVEQAAIVNSIRNLMGFPWLAERVAAGKVVLHAWWFNLTEGQLYAFDPNSARFKPVLGVELAPAVEQATPLSAIAPARLVEALAGRPPSF